MAIRFLPEPGMILICDFEGHIAPEMVKTRRVVVVSRRRYFRSTSDATAIVVPLSVIEPRPFLAWHHRIAGGRYAGVATCWAKGDLVTHVALVRLNRIFQNGSWLVPVVTADDLAAIRATVTSAIGCA